MENLSASSIGNLPDKVLVGELNKIQLRQALRESNIQLNQAAEDLFLDHRFVPAIDALEIEIKAISVLELGFVKGATYPRLAAGAAKLGLSECPLELGPYLRLQFLQQSEICAKQPSSSGQAPQGAITIASRPLCEEDTVPKGFYLKNTGGTLWLRGYWSDFEHSWSPHDIFIFCLLNKPKNP